VGEDDDRRLLRLAGMGLTLLGLWLIWKSSRGGGHPDGDRLPGGPTDSTKGP
jgi:hypothetical protein